MIKTVFNKIISLFKTPAQEVQQIAPIVKEIQSVVVEKQSEPEVQIPIVPVVTTQPPKKIRKKKSRS